MDADPPQPAAPETWLMLIFQLPAKPAYLRVKIWRRLQSLGAVAVKNSVYALPANAQARDDFQWLLRDIHKGGGEGMVCESWLVEGLSDAQLHALFDQARDADYEAIAQELQALARGSAADEEQRLQQQAQLRRLRQRFGEVENIDFFGAHAHHATASLLVEFEARFVTAVPTLAAPVAPPLEGIHGHTWVTRRGVKVDRIASAWLISRCIDVAPRFKFVKDKHYQAQPGELRFDMFDAEYSHEGSHCTFETLLRRAALSDPALTPIAQIVHDLDLKDSKYDRAETGGIGTLLDGICVSTDDDEERLRRGGAVFEYLYRSFSRKSA
jgi:muconolactone delta-isomerase